MQSNHFRILDVFGKTDVIMARRQPHNLREILTRAKFELVPEVRYKPPAGLYPCRRCTYCKRGYIKATTRLELHGKDGWKVEWNYTRHFTCESRNILYVCRNIADLGFYLGKTKVAKTRVSKHISDVHHPENSKCREFIDHTIKVSQMKEPFFYFYPFFYAEEDNERDFMEKRFISRFKPTLNGYNTV